MIPWILSFLALALLLLFIDYRKLAALKKLILPFFIVLCLACLILFIFLLYDHLSYKNEIIQSTKSRLINLTVEARKEIERILQETMDAAESIANEVSSGELKNDEILARLKTTAEQNQNFYGINIAYKPYAYSPDRKLYSPYYGKKGGVITFSQLDEIYDYTQPEYEWYTLAMEKGPRWCEPYFGEAGRTLISTYSALFYETDPAPQRREPIGVVTIDISLDQIGKIIRSLDLGPSGFGALLSQQGRYLYHPNNEYVLSGKTILELGEELNDADRISLGEKISKGEGGILDHVSSTTGLSAWLIYEPVPVNGWSLNNTFIKSDIQMNVDSLRKQQVRICVVSLLFLWSLAAIVLGIHRGYEKTLWLMSTITAVLLLAGIGYVWHLALNFNRDNDEDAVRITTQATLNTITQKYTEECAARHTEPPVYIPTGIFLESIRLSGACDVAVSGYIWQTYSDSLHRDWVREFQIGGAQDVNVTEMCRHREGDEEILRWFFQAKLSERFDNSEYPLNQETISISLLHKELNHNVVLAPDLTAYRVTSPTSLPGLEKDLLIPGWTVMRSFFNFRKITYDTDFGVEKSILKENFPALSFSVIVRRNFLDSFISCLTPLIVVALLLFSIFFLSTKDPEKIKLLGVSPGRSLGFCAGLFFVVVFSHIGTRKAISAEEIFYLEYFYLVMYLTLLWVSVNAILHILADKILFIQYKDNLISKVLYWPVLLALLFWITVVFFYEG